MNAQLTNEMLNMLEHSMHQLKQAWACIEFSKDRVYPDERTTMELQLKSINRTILEINDVLKRAKEKL